MKTIKLKRIFKGDDSSMGVLYIEDIPVCFVIEDEDREIKVKGETRIPSGKYEIKKRITETSPKTLRYREIYDWFDYHIEIQDVPNFKYIYIHHGNTDDNTEGCLLVNFNGYVIDYPNGKYDYEGGRSRDAFSFVYNKLSSMLGSGQVFIEIIDE